MHRFFIKYAGFVVALLAGAGCAADNASMRTRLSDMRPRISREELVDLLAQLEDTFEAVTNEATERIIEKDKSRRTRRLTLMWKTRLVPMVRDALNQDEPVHALLDLWVLCLQVQDYFRDGAGRDLFGEGQHVAREAADNCVKSVEQVATKILTPEVLGRARDAVHSLARKSPVRGEFSVSAVRTAVQKAPEGADVLTAIIAAPLAPFRAIEGIDRGAAAIRGFSAVAARMNETVHDLPELTRLQAELLLMEIEELESAQTALASFSKFADASARFTVAVEKLPEDLRKELSLAMKDMEDRQGGLQKTLAEAREVVDRINEGLGQVKASAAAVEHTAVHTARAGDAWTGTFHSITDMVASFRGEAGLTSRPAESVDISDSASVCETDTRTQPDKLSLSVIASQPAGDSLSAVEVDANQRRKFDILDYAHTAEAVEQAAGRIQAATVELRGLINSSQTSDSLAEIETRVCGIVERSRLNATDLTDYVAWRAAQLILLVFVLLAAYTGFLRLLSRGRVV